MTDNKHGMTETNTLELAMNTLLSLFQYKIEECISFSVPSVPLQIQYLFKCHSFILQTKNIKIHIMLRKCPWILLLRTFQ